RAARSDSGRDSIDGTATVSSPKWSFDDPTPARQPGDASPTYNASTPSVDDIESGDADPPRLRRVEPRIPQRYFQMQERIDSLIKRLEGITISTA
ncbi:hypothetical protein FOZ63_008926, partial [Perkinsus olseni]